MPRKIIYIINPVSGTGKKKDLQEFIKKKTAEQKISYSIFQQNAGIKLPGIKPDNYLRIPSTIPKTPDQILYTW